MRIRHEEDAALAAPCVLTPRRTTRSKLPPMPNIGPVEIIALLILIALIACVVVTVSSRRR
jgi:hypothetical protein